VTKKLVSIPLFASGCFLFYYGTGMLFLVPGDPGENYFKSLFNGRFLYGVVPFLTSMGAFVAVGWLWSRPGDSAHLRKSIKRTLVAGFGAIALFWICLIIMADLRQGF
jgi:hypothetical protein